MSNTIDRVSTALLVGSLVANYASHKTGHGTICQTTRPIWGRDPETGRMSKSGKIKAATGWAVLTAWFLPHYFNG